MKKSFQLSMDLYYIGMILYIYGMKPCMILYIYGMKPYHICIKSYGVIVSHTVFLDQMGKNCLSKNFNMLSFSFSIFHTFLEWEFSGLIPSFLGEPCYGT